MNCGKSIPQLPADAEPVGAAPAGGGAAPLFEGKMLPPDAAVPQADFAGAAPASLFEEAAADQPVFGGDAPAGADAAPGWFAEEPAGDAPVFDDMAPGEVPVEAAGFGGGFADDAVGFEAPPPAGEADVPGDTELGNLPLFGEEAAEVSLFGEEVAAAPLEAEGGFSAAPPQGQPEEISLFGEGPALAGDAGQAAPGQADLLNLIEQTQQADLLDMIEQAQGGRNTPAAQPDSILPQEMAADGEQARLAEKASKIQSLFAGGDVEEDFLAEAETQAAPTLFDQDAEPGFAAPEDSPHNLFEAGEAAPENALGQEQSAPAGLFGQDAFEAPAQQADLFAPAEVSQPEQGFAQGTQEAGLFGQEPGAGSWAEPQPQQAKPTRAQKKEKAAASRAKRRAEKAAPAADDVPPEETRQIPVKAEKKQPPAPPPINLPQQEVVRRRNPVRTLLTIVGIVIIFAVVFSGTILAMLYFQNRPSKVVDDFVAAIEARDVKAVEELVRVRGVSPGKDEWNAFFDAFEHTAGKNALKSQLLMQAEDPDVDTENFLYAAVSIQKHPFIWFIDQYQITISSVDLLAVGAEAGSTVWLNGVEYAGAASGEGMLYTGLMPGRYESRLVPPGGDASVGELTEIEIFGVNGPNVLEGEVPRATITIANCISNEIILSVNGQVVAGVAPVDGVVTLENIALGSTIRVELTDGNGTRMEASVVFSDINVTALSFENYTAVGGEVPSSVPDSSSEAPAANITAEEINTVMSAFYQSYIACINAQSADGIQQATAAYKAALPERLSSDGNKANEFEYVSISCDAASIVITESGAVHFNVQCNFRYRTRGSEDAYTDGVTYQSVELVQENGQWLVNKMVYVSEGDFQNHVIADF